MAVYKVPQDVEADDKLIGPFSFKQFVFIIITVGFLYIGFVLARANPILAVIPLPGAIFFGVLGLWPRKDQPIEVYLMAVIRFWMKPRKRLWSQEGHKEHVRITAPITDIDHKYSDGLSRGEVQSRLQLLADNLDSRGWNTRHVGADEVAAGMMAAQQQSDRLVVPQAVVAAVPEPSDIHSSDDILDIENNPIAQKFDELSRTSTQAARDQAISYMHNASTGNDDDSNIDVNYNPYPNMQQTVVNPVGDQQANDQSQHGGLSTNPQPLDQSSQAQPNSAQPQLAQPPVTDQNQNTSTMTPAPSPAILELSRNSDWNISTLARQAEQSLHDEDVVELH